MWPWVFVGIAIVAEIVATSFIGKTEGFTRLVPTIGVLFGYAVSFFALSQAVKRIEVGVVYAIWSGVGTAAIAIIGVLFLHESSAPTKITGLLLIIVGVVVLNLTPSGQV